MSATGLTGGLDGDEVEVPVRGHADEKEGGEGLVDVALEGRLQFLGARREHPLGAADELVALVLLVLQRHTPG